MNNTILKGITILKLISNSRKTLTSTEISKLTSIPKTTTFNIIGSLIKESILEIDNPQLKTYKLGLSSYEIGIKYINNLDLYKTALPFLKELSLLTNQTAFLVKKEKEDIIYIAKVEPEISIRTTITLGTRIPSYSSSLGKAILSSYPKEKLIRYLQEITLTKKTENTIIDKEKLLESLIEDKKNGYSISNGENEENLFCIGAPIFDFSNKVIGAISISTIINNITDEVIEKNSQIIVKISQQLSKTLGYNNNL